MIVEVSENFPTTPGKYIALGHDLFALVDDFNFDWLNRYKWYAKKSFGCWYACRKVIDNGKAKIIRMHRIIAKTPDDMVCHHINHNPFDNRFANLLNMSEFDHTKMFSWR